MGWFSSDDTGVKKTSGGAFETPSRTNRAKCYEARDAFFDCLDRNSILDSINSKNGRAATAKACGGEDQVFEKNCAHSWVRDPTWLSRRRINYESLLTSEFYRSNTSRSNEWSTTRKK